MRMLDAEAVRAGLDPPALVAHSRCRIRELNR